MKWMNQQVMTKCIDADLECCQFENWIWFEWPCIELIIWSINFKSIANSTTNQWHFTSTFELLLWICCYNLTQFEYNTDTDMVEMSIQWFIFSALLYYALFNNIIACKSICLRKCVRICSMKNYVFFSGIQSSRIPNVAIGFGEPNLWKMKTKNGKIRLVLTWPSIFNRN